MAMNPILGFMPDADPKTPGVLTDCTNMVPTEKGMAGAPTEVDAVSGLAALGAECRGAAVLIDTVGNRRTFAGTTAALYELSSSSWTDRSAVGGYSGGTDDQWSFAQFGNIALAAIKTDTLQFSASGAFAAVSGAPKARIIVSAKNFVIAFDTNDGTYGDQSDRWWCSAFQDYSDWTPAVSTQCTTGRLVDVAGGFTAGKTLGGYVVAYKERGMFLGQYVGAPVVWQWDPVPGEIGCVGMNAVADIGNAHIFVGPDNIWMYDGTRNVPIAHGLVRQWFYDDSSATYRFKTIVHHDKQNSLVWIFYPGSSSTYCDRALVYHLVSKRWGRVSMAAEAVLQFVTPGLTWDTLDTLASTWDTLPDISWDSQTWQAGGRSIAMFNTSHQLKSLTGQTVSCTMTTGDLGDDWSDSLLTASRLRFEAAPTSATGNAQYRNGDGETYTTSSTATGDQGRFDFNQDARWHRVSYTFSGNVEVTGMDFALKATGAR